MLIIFQTRLALLSAGHSVHLRDLLRSISSFSYAGDLRNLIVDESKKARNMVSADLLSFIHLYVPLLPTLRTTWKLKLDEGDDDILKGRYTPDQFRSESEIPNSQQNDFQLQFDLVFKKPHHEQLLLDIIDKTKKPLHKVSTSRPIVLIFLSFNSMLLKIYKADCHRQAAV